MIDNFFRLHEKNRQLNWDDYFGKARYDLPQALGTAAASASAAGSVEAAVDEALRQALQQLPACASLDLAVVAVGTEEERDTDAVLAHLAKLLPGETRVVGWAGPDAGPSAAPTADGMDVGVVSSAGGTVVSITLASLPAVKGKGFFVSEDELCAWAAQAGDVKPLGPVNPEDEDGPVRFLGDKKWELRVDVTVNEAYKDPPVFLLFGNLREAALAHVAIQGLDVTYPGTAKIGGLAPPGAADKVVLFSREGGPQGSAGARILKEDAGTPGLLGLALVGDVRTMTYVSQGAEAQPGAGAFRVEAVSEDGQRITKVAPVSGDGPAATPKEAGIQDGQELALGLGNDKPSSGGGMAGKVESEEPEGADRWSLVSVRGSRQAAVVVPPEQWRLEGDGSLRLEGRVAKPGHYLSWYKQDAAVALAQEAELVSALEAEIEAEWTKAELGVMKFRPTGVLAVRGRGYPVTGLGKGLGKALARALPTAPVACLDAAGGQWAPLEPARTSALLPEALVLNVLACKAKRRDLREIRYDFRDFGAEKRPSPLDLTFDVERPLLDAETGEVAVNRQAALIGTDVRVDNMAWNVREERVLPTSLYESMVWSKERELHFVREEAPLLNLMRTVMMIIKSADPATQAKAAGLDVAAALDAAAAKSSDGWAVLGEISRGSPFHGIVGPTYDPGAAAKAMLQHAGAGAVSVRVDQTYYGGKYTHVRDVKDAFRQPEGAEAAGAGAAGAAAAVPVVADDLVLYPYQLYLAKLFGADGVKMGLAVLSDEDLQYQVKICKTLSLTPVISVASLVQLRRAAALPLNQTSIIALEDRDQGTMRRHPGVKHPALAWLHDAQVQASLEARRANKGNEEAAASVGSGGAPLLLVAGRPVEDAAERAELKALGVAGAVVSYVDMPPSVISEAATAAAVKAVEEAAAKPKQAAVDASKLGALFM